MTSRGRGRPRDTGIDTAILTAACDLMSEGGYERMTVEAIAARARVGKQTVYRRWPSKAAIVAETVLSGHLVLHLDPVEDTGDLGADLRRWLEAQFRRLEDPASTSVVRGLVAAATDSGEAADRLYDRITGPSRAHLQRRLAAGAEHGQIRADLDTGAAADAITGALLYRALVPDSARSGSDAEGLLDLFFCGMAPSDAGARHDGGTAPG